MRYLSTTPWLSKIMSLCLLCGIVAVGQVSTVQAYEWTAYTSEEDEPRTCDIDKMASGFGCQGSFCDNMRLECHNPGITRITDRHWLDQVSEEGYNYRFCPSGEYFTGVAASGGYADNVSFECGKASGLAMHSCKWTDWVSEEGTGRLYFPSGYFARGVQCSGSRCDNKRFRICNTKYVIFPPVFTP